MLYHLKNSMFIIYNQVVKPSMLVKAEDVRGWVKARMWFNINNIYQYITINP